MKTNQPTELATTLPDLVKEVRAFIHWVAANDFTDPENMLVCAEWFNLCGAVGEPMRMAGEVFRQQQKLSTGYKLSAEYDNVSITVHWLNDDSNDADVALTCFPDGKIIRTVSPASGVTPVVSNVMDMKNTK